MTPETFPENPSRIFALSKQLERATLPSKCEETERAAVLLELLGAVAGSRDPLLLQTVNMQAPRLFQQATHKVDGIWDWVDGQGGLRPEKVADGPIGARTYFFGKAIASIVIRNGGVFGLPDDTLKNLPYRLSRLCPKALTS